jgi:uncharacterized Zn finger protein
LQPSPQYPRKPTPNIPLKPRRVRGGVKLTADYANATDSPIPWATQRWIRLIEQSAAGPNLVEGLDYGRLGQTKRLDVVSGAVKAQVQGRQYRPYDTTIKVTAFTHEQWDQIVTLMSDQAVYAAKILAGELPPNIEEIFSRIGVRLFPTEPGDVTTTCTCPDRIPWCKHACAVASLLADQLGAKPFLMFELRGISTQDLMERLRQQRAMSGVGASAAAIYTPHPPGEYTAKPLEECLHSFWDLPSGDGRVRIDTPLEPPAVSHPLLRRLGPSPFAGHRFPLVGLLATCYEMVSKAAIEGTRDDLASEKPDDIDADPEDPEDTDRE